MLLHNRPCGFYYQFVFYLTAVHQSEEDVGARNDDKHLSGFSSGRTKRWVPSLSLGDRCRRSHLVENDWKKTLALRKKIWDMRTQGQTFSFLLANKWFESKGKLREWKEDMQLKPQYENNKAVSNLFFRSFSTEYSLKTWYLICFPCLQHAKCKEPVSSWRSASSQCIFGSTRYLQSHSSWLVCES